jgi:branched-chain amino acid transport system substrate-binding protein
MITRRLFSLSAASAGAMALAGLNPARAQSDKSDNRIVIGQSAAFTGPSAQLGIQFHAGAKLWFDEENARGGVGGKLVEIRKLDDGYDPERSAANTKQLIDEGVFALFGYIGTPTSMAALPMIKAEGIPFVAPFTGAMALREPYLKNVFHLRASYNDETALIVKQLTHLGLKKIAVFHQNDAYGKAGLDGVNLALTASGLAPVATATVERNTVDVASAVKTLIDAKPDAIVQIGAYKACAAFIRASRKAGYGGTFYNVSFVGTKALSDELGKEGAGVMVSQVVPSPYSSSRQIAREFAESIKKGGDTVVANFSSMEGYLAAKLFTEGLKRASGGTLTRQSFIRGLESMGNHSLGGFATQLSSVGHVASSYVELSMLVGDGRVRT